MCVGNRYVYLKSTSNSLDGLVDKNGPYKSS